MKPMTPAGVLLSLAIGTATLPAQQQRVNIPSSVFGHPRAVDISLPRRYERDTTRRYPVIFVLDGESQGELAAATAQFYASTGVIPSAIVVAIRNEARERDFTPTPIAGFDAPSPNAGGADRFLSFIAGELIPRIDRDFRTLPFRVLIGHSLGGLFAVHAAAERPELFNGFVIMEPSVWWNNGEPLARLRTAVTRPAARRERFIMVNAQLPAEDTTSWGGDRPMIRAIDVHGQSHESMPVTGISLGLRRLFEDFQPQPWIPGKAPIQMLARPESLDYRLGVHVPVPIDTYTKVVMMSMNARLFDDAELALEKMVQAGATPSEVADLRREVAATKAEPPPAGLIPLAIAKERPTPVQAKRFIGTWKTIEGGRFAQQVTIRASGDTIVVHSLIRQREAEPREEDHTVIGMTADGTLEWGRSAFINLAALMIQKAMIQPDGTMLIREEARGWVIRDPNYRPMELRLRRVTP